MPHEDGKPEHLFSHYIHVDNDEQESWGQEKFNKSKKQKEEEGVLRRVARERNRAVVRAMLRRVLRSDRELH